MDITKRCHENHDFFLITSNSALASTQFTASFGNGYKFELVDFNFPLLKMPEATKQYNEQPKKLLKITCVAKLDSRL